MPIMTAEQFLVTPPGDDRARYERIIAERDAKAGPFRATIEPDAVTAEISAHWYVLLVASRTERAAHTSAAAHLIGRGFGTYVPELELTVVVRGAARIRRELMFPGYLFVYLWGFAAQWRRVRSCPGVYGVLQDGSGSPAVVPDHVISEIQVAENMRDPALWVPSKKKKRSRRDRREARVGHDGAAAISIKTRSYINELAGFDSGGRIDALRLALGLDPRLSEPC